LDLAKVGANKLIPAPLLALFYLEIGANKLISAPLLAPFTLGDQMTGTLYIVSTPIGNLGDMTPRAVEVLGSVAVVACEDTRHSGQLMKHLALNVKLISFYEHNEERRCASLIKRLLREEDVALISDAGTPLISDPGYLLVSMARDAGIEVSPIPGACALVAALSVSGLPTDRFYFAGFLPPKSGPRQRRLEAIESMTCTLVFYESPHRIIDSLTAMSVVFGAEREVVVARELTKLYETIRAGTLEDVLAWVKEDPNQQKGEFVVLVAGKEDVVDEDEALRVMNILNEELPTKQAASLASKITGAKKNWLYNQVKR